MVNETYPVFIVAHQDNPILEDFGLPYHIRENRGLEFGAYNWYLQNKWQSGPVLFQHDDAKVNGLEPYHRINELLDDQTYIFGSEYEYKRNRGLHGRAFKCSNRLLSAIKGNGGIWYDHKNPGNVFNLHPDPAIDGLDFNAGICRFRDDMNTYKNKGFNVAKYIILPSFQNGERGKFRQEVL